MINANSSRIYCDDKPDILVIMRRNGCPLMILSFTSAPVVRCQKRRVDCIRTVYTRARAIYLRAHTDAIVHGRQREAGSERDS